ncbi:MAG TPA: hypothetical protein DGT23_23470 [Micromonosporaceae bacterium]|nr:hypothetical protein [Micromonosporaceae bacterium]
MRLLGDDGKVHRLETDYVIGSEPVSLPGNARALRLHGNVAGISRHHVLVSPVGSRLRVTDLGSTNGTYLLFPDSVHLRLVEPGESVEIPSGTQIKLAKRSFYYEFLGDVTKAA